MTTAAEAEEELRLLPWFRYARNWPDEDRCELVWLLAHAILAIQNACLVGSQAPKVKDMWERMSNPQPGDVVLETSSVWRDNWPERALGRLVETFREDWEYDDDETPPRGRVWIVESLYFFNHPRTEWENAHFIALPIDESNFLGKRGRVVFTRDNLLGTLANSGFELKR